MAGEAKKAQKKVLLIGLGGTGCAVVSRVKQLVEKNDDRLMGQRETNIEFLGFDTDTNQEDAPGLQIIRTSRDAKVFEMLRTEKNWREWFPDNNQLMNRDMEHGAGQKRVLSRLAFSDTLRRRGSMAELERALQRLNAANGMQNCGLKVMIVSSFAGGTGSGMFLQVPLFLRQYIEEKYVGMNVMIRGLFALPDVFRSQSNGAIQLESMYSNAYACLRELAAVNRVCLSDNPETITYDVKIEGMFDSRKMLRKCRKENKNLGETGVPDTIPAGKKPYDIIFFVDDLNANRNTLSHKEEYIQQMSEITYMQVYSPMAANEDSLEDNLIEETMESDGEAMYSSAGTARLVYPYDDVLDYLGRKSTVSLISDRWTVFDRAFKNEMQEAKERRKTDFTVTTPKRDAHFVEHMDKNLGEGNRHFTFLKDALFVVRTEKKRGDDGNAQTLRETKARDEVYFKAIEEYIQASFDRDSDMRIAAKRCTFNKDSAKSGDNLKTEVKNMENALEGYEAVINARTDAMYLSIANSILPDNLESAFDDSEKPYNIHQLLEISTMDGRHSIHPLAARYLLYKLRSRVKKQWENYDNDRTVMCEEIKAYKTEDRDKKTEKIDRYVDVVPEHGAHRRNTFIRKYETDSANQKANLEAYSVDRLFAAVYKVLLERLDAVIAQYERVFDMLDSIVDNMNTRIAQLELKYSKQTPNETYLCVDPEFLQEIYEELDVLDEEDCAGDVYDGFFTEVYGNAMNQLKYQKSKSRKCDDYQKAYQREMEAEMDNSIIDMFETRIYPSYKETLVEKQRDAFDFDLFTALDREVKMRLQRQAMLSGKGRKATADEVDIERRSILNEVYLKASPYLLSREYHIPNPGMAGTDDGVADSHGTMLWGVNDKVYADIQKRGGNAQQYFEISDATGTNIVPHRMYTRYELACYRAKYSITLTEIPKFCESDDPDKQGIFYRNYRSRIRKMLLGRYGRIDEGITPHLDIKWHSRQYLPTIDTGKSAQDDKNAARAMWLAYLYRCLDDPYNSKTSKHEGVVNFYKPSINGAAREVVYGALPLIFNGQPVLTNRVYDVFKALQQNSLIWEQLLEVLESALEHDSKMMRTNNYDFTGKRANPLAKAMIGKGSEKLEVEQQPDDEDEEVRTTTEERDTNLLLLMGRVIRDMRATREERQLILDGMLDVIEEFTEEMSADRKATLLRAIFEKSPYTKKTLRKNAELMLVPYFEKTMEAYDNEHSRSRKTADAAEAPADDTAEAPAAKTTRGKKKASTASEE